MAYNGPMQIGAWRECPLRSFCSQNRRACQPAASAACRSTLADPRALLFVPPSIPTAATAYNDPNMMQQQGMQGMQGNMGGMPPQGMGMQQGMGMPQGGMQMGAGMQHY